MTIKFPHYSDCLTTGWKFFSKTCSLVPQRLTPSRRITCKHIDYDDDDDDDGDGGDDDDDGDHDHHNHDDDDQNLLTCPAEVDTIKKDYM